jgi:plastocyanin domain-containing protein
VSSNTNTGIEEQATVDVNHFDAPAVLWQIEDEVTKTMSTS